MQDLNEEQVVLVNERDEELGTMGKLEAHEKGVLHRAFSVFVFNDAGEFLLQRRADGKYHSAGLWTNTCCSHPRKGEALENAARRRLREEMGIELELKHRFSFIYKAGFDNGLHEHELDHVFFGRYDGDPRPDTDEVSEWKWMPVTELDADLKAHPGHYTVWLRDCWKRIMQEIERDR
jgi:isopentenyl-diphosphate Delta-isomerase